MTAPLLQGKHGDHDHEHDHAHDHAGGHVHTGAGGRRGLLFALGITLFMMLAEIVGGVLSNSLALLSDAGHMFTDTLALALSFFAMKFASRSAFRSLAMRVKASSQEMRFHSFEPAARYSGYLSRSGLCTKSSRPAPLGQSVPRLTG